MNNYYEEVIVSIQDGKTDKGIPYVELEICYFLGYPIDVSFRSYSKNVWIVYTDDRGNPFSGVDLLDCWIAPSVLFDKVNKKNFNLKKELKRICRKLELLDDMFLEEELNEIVEKVGQVKNEYLLSRQ